MSTITPATVEVPMPRLSEAMEEGTVLQWLKEEGEAVARGDELVEIEIDKATLIHEAEADGVLRIVAEAGETLPVGATIARLEAGEGGSASAPAPAAAAADAVAAPVAPVTATGVATPPGDPAVPASPL
uniref:lipoyl domain-containing protein n=1 Tax=Patulibacter defluvii TaxID=3095358 RepID=UPI002A756D29